MSISRTLRLCRSVAAVLLAATAAVAVAGAPAQAAWVPNFSGRAPAAALNSNGTLELFATDGNDQVWHRWQTSPGAQTWTPWTGFGDGVQMRSLAAEANGSGISLFGFNSLGQIFHRWQQPGGWTAWQPVPDLSARSLAVARSGDGRLHLFAVGRSIAQLYHAVQAAPGTNQWSAWSLFDSTAQAVVAQTNADGGIDLFALDGGGRAMWRTQQITGWSAWTVLDGSFTALTAGRNKDGRLEVFGASSTGRVMHRSQIAVGSGIWAPWVPFTGLLRSLAAETNLDGRMELFGATNLGQFSHRWQHTGGWSELTLLPGALSPPFRGGGTHSVLDGGGVTGAYPAIATGVDGLAVIAYRNETTGSLKVAHCNNPECTSATTTVVDSTGNAGFFNSIAIGGDGLPVIAYVAKDPRDLRLAHCLNTACTQSTTVTLDPESNVDSIPGLAIGNDGMPVLAYSHRVSAHNDPVYVIGCRDHGCASVTWHQVYSGQFTASGLSIEIASDGNPTFIVDEGPLRIGHCGTPDCATVTGVTDYFGNSSRISTTVGVDGKILTAMNSPSLPDGRTAEMFVSRCADPACTSFDSGSMVDFGGLLGVWPSLRIGEDGFGVVSYFEHDAGVLRLAHCNDIGCSAATNTGLLPIGPGAGYTALTIGHDGMPLIAYQQPGVADLKILHCDNPLCTGF
ncbi:hypothetical protein [Rhizocola hellebori]|nr:hypothetical protein [Rhizocola hellebori]